MIRKRIISALIVGTMLFGSVVATQMEPVYADDSEDSETTSYKLFTGESKTIDVGEKVKNVYADDEKIVSAFKLTDDENYITISAIRKGSTSVYATTSSGAVEEYDITVRETGIKFKVSEIGNGRAQIDVINDRKIAFEEMILKYVLRDENMKEVTSGLSKLIEVPAENTYTYVVTYNPILHIDPDYSAFHIRSFRYTENELNEDLSDDVEIEAEDMPEIAGMPVMTPVFNITNNSDEDVHVLVSARFYDDKDNFIGAIPFNVGGIVAGEDVKYQVYEQNLDYVLGWKTIKLKHFAWSIGKDKDGNELE